MVKLFIDNTEVVRFADKLRTMHRSDLPIVVRQTLNDLAFDVKKTTLLKSADNEFILRNPSFFKRNSGVKKATGFDIDKMSSEVGILKNDSKAAQQLTKQEYGGKISNRPYIYMNQARTSGSKSKMVRRVNYLNTKGIIKGGKSFIGSAYKAKKENKNLLWKTKSGETLMSINSISNSKVKATPIADYEKNRSVTISARPFLKPATMNSFKKREYFFIRNAKKRFERALQ